MVSLVGTSFLIPLGSQVTITCLCLPCNTHRDTQRETHTETHRHTHTQRETHTERERHTHTHTQRHTRSTLSIQFYMAWMQSRGQKHGNNMEGRTGGSVSSLGLMQTGTGGSSSRPPCLYPWVPVSSIHYQLQSIKTT